MSEANGERLTRQSENERALSRDRYDAVLLDLDGVITDTASVHAACWKQMFDEYLQKIANWLPIPPGAFNIMLRVYGPEGTVKDNTYVPPGIRKR